jgi:RNA polymerase sigma factor (TIGR02999 family)
MSRAGPGDGRTGHVTRLLDAAGSGDAHAAADLLPIVYEELRELARRRMSAEPAGQTLQTTALVHEAYLRLIGETSPDEMRWENIGHFFGAAARAMRRILVERARHRRRLKRGGGRRRIPLADDAVTDGSEPVDVIALDDALNRLEQYDERKAQIVLLRYFAGLTIEQTAQAMSISPATVKSDWQYVRAWLHRELSGA